MPEKKEHIAYKDSYFSKALHKYGIDNFLWEVLEETDSECLLNILEKYYISEYKKIGELYNMTKGGDGGDVWSEHPRRNEFVEVMRKRMSGVNNPMYGIRLSEERKAQLRIYLNNSTRHAGKLHSEETKQKYSLQRTGNKNPMYGKNHSIKTRLKLSEICMGRESPFKGKHHTEDNKKLFSDIIKNLEKKQCPYCNKFIDPGNYGRYHGNKCKHKKES